MKKLTEKEQKQNELLEMVKNKRELDDQNYFS